MVRMDASQASDPGSIPGWRISFYHAYLAETFPQMGKNPEIRLAFLKTLNK